MSDEKLKRATQYSIKILSKIEDLIREDEDLQSELGDEVNFQCFLHAISTMIPNGLYNGFTGDDLDNLEYNHLANKLCFEICIKRD